MHNYEDLDPESKVWVYQSSRPFTEEEKIAINKELEEFATEWVAHKKELKAFGKVYYDRFIVLIVDETQNPVSGCSIDSSVHFLKELEQKYNIELFNRLNVAYRDNGNIKLMPTIKIANERAAGNIHQDTVIFNNLVATKAELEQQWEVPLKDSWVIQFA